MSRKSYIIKFEDEDCYKVGYIRSGTIAEKLKNYPNFEVVYTKEGYDPNWEKAVLSSVVKYKPKELVDKSGRFLSGANSKFFTLPNGTSVSDILGSLHNEVYLYQCSIDNSVYYLSEIELTTDVLFVHTFKCINKKHTNELFYQAKTRTKVLDTYDKYFSFRLMHKSIDHFISDIDKIRPMLDPVIFNIFKISDFYSAVILPDNSKAVLPSSERVYSSRVERPEAKQFISWINSAIGLEKIEYDTVAYVNCFRVDDIDSVINKTFVNKNKILSSVLDLLENLNDVDDIKALIRVHMS